MVRMVVDFMTLLSERTIVLNEFDVLLRMARQRTSVISFWTLVLFDAQRNLRLCRVCTWNFMYLFFFFFGFFAGNNLTPAQASRFVK